VADFDTFALAGGRMARRVIAIDSRGHGQSDYDSILALQKLDIGQLNR
jgi:hypothetical protein